MSDGPRRFEITNPNTITDPVALSIGLYSLTGQGKTRSGLHLAHGIARVYQCPVVLADCDNGRGLHFVRGAQAMFPNVGYIDFKAPHNAMDYVDLLAQVSRDRVVLMIDNMSAEHEGEGGLIDTYEDAKQGKESRNAVAWGKAKAQHKQLVRAFVAANRRIPIIVTWRAQEKLDWAAKNDRGQTEPKSQGEMPIGSKDLPFEMTATYLLPAGSKGAPCLEPKEKGERLMTKIPGWFESIVRPGEKFTEVHGEAMARWAIGNVAASTAPASPPPIGERASLILEALRSAESAERVTEILRGDYDRACKERQIRRHEGERIRAYADERRRALSGELPPDAEPAGAQ